MYYLSDGQGLWTRLWYIQSESRTYMCLENIPAVDVRGQANGGIGGSPEPVYKGPDLRVWSLSEGHVTNV